VSRETYEGRRDRFAAAAARLGRRSLRFSIARGVSFAAFAVCLFLVVFWASGPAAVRAVWAAAACFAVFFALVQVHGRVIREQRRQETLVAINREALLRLDRDWDQLPPSQLPPPPDDGAATARDLGLFGRASLAQLLGTVHSPPGKGALREWLLRPAPPEEIAARQPAVAELAPELELRQTLELLCRPLAAVPFDFEPFLAWAEGAPWLRARPWLLWTARLLAVATLGLVVATILELAPVRLLLFVLTVNFALSRSWGKRMNATFERISSREGEFQLYAEALGLLAAPSFSSPRLAALSRELTDGEPADRSLALLHRRVELSDARHSTLLHFFLQTLTLWDFHMIDLLERWQLAAGRHARRWLAALGDFEALAALAALRFDNPDWAMPEVRAGEDRFAARSLGHPLLPAARRVSNDVEVGPADTFLLVTGSNMSGKSTLLRSVGINAVLAQAGGPVCAAALRLPPLRLATSILIEDSLADGVSFFMAELQRIRQIVLAADRAASEGAVLLYLLDEILRGTNSEERLVAVQRVVAHLIAVRAIGAVSTHDLRLAEAPALQGACHPVHFRETIKGGEGGPVMTFDYVLREGVATTVNALALLDLMGLGAGPARIS